MAVETQAARRIVSSTSAEQRLREARDWIAAHDGERLVVAPSRSAADELVRQCARGAGLIGLHRANPTQLASDLATAPMARQKLAPLTALGAEALAARAVYQSGTLDYFAPIVNTPGFPRALARTIRELRAARVAGRTLSGTSKPGADLDRLLTAYDQELGDRADNSVLFTLATEIAREGKHRLVGLPLLLLDVAPSSEVEIAFLRELAAAAPSVLATVIHGDERVASALTRICDATVDDLDAGDEGDAPTGRLQRLRRYMFLSDAPEPEPADDDAAQGDVEFFSAPGEGRECVELVRRMLKYAAAGVPFDAMAVLLRNPEGYQSLLEDAMRRGGVPAYFTHGTVRPDPSGRAFLALLHCRTENLSASRFSEYLSLGQVPNVDTSTGALKQREVPWVEPKGDQMVFKTLVAEPEQPAPGAPLDDEVDTVEESPVVAGTLQAPTHWERLIVDAAVVGGQDRWARRLAGLRAELELKCGEAGTEEESLRDHLQRQIERLDRLERFALPLVDVLASLPVSADWGEWLAHLERLATLALRRPGSVLGVLAELKPMADVGPVELDEVRDVLTDRLTFLRVEPPRRRYGRAFVSTVDEARGRAFDIVFLPGLAEGIFPRKAVEDPLLLDEHRVGLDADLLTQDRRVAEERLLLRVAAGAATKRLVASYPRVDVLMGRARVPSFYALDVLRAAEGSLPDLADLEKRAAGASASHLGWPSPRERSEAIDDTEYDLAVLWPLLKAQARRTEGQGNFLLHVNEHLARSLRMRGRRWRRFWSSADGLVEPDEATLAVLHKNLPTERSFSPTSLQHYSACPYRFLLQAIHRLRPRDEIVRLEQMDPLTRGSLFHEMQAEFLRELKDDDMLPITEAIVDEVLRRADIVLDRVGARYEEKLAPAIPRVWKSEMEGLRIDLRGWVRKVIELDPPWRPAYFELAFGLSGDPGDRDPASVTEEAIVADGMRLRGSVDLVELNDETDTVRVTDHKTGKAPWKHRVVIQGGEVLQPILYGLAVEKMLGKTVEVGRLFYCTQRGEYRTVDVPLDRERRELGAEVLNTIDKAVRDGFLPAAPRDRACEWCDFKSVCGPYEELRYSRKRAEPRLKGLDDLRRRE